MINWIFLNLKKNDCNNLDFAEKEKIFNEVLWIEYLAKEFETETILSTGTSYYIKVKNDVQEIKKKDTSVKAALVAKKTTSKGFAAIKKQLGYKKES